MKLALVVVCSWVSVARADDRYACREASPDTKVEVAFAPNVSMKDLVTWVAGFTCKNIVLPSDALAAAPTVTVIAMKPLTPKQALQLFVDSVEATGLVVTVKPDTIIIKLGPGMPKSCPPGDAVKSGEIKPFPTRTPPPSPVATSVDETQDEKLAAAIAADVRDLDANTHEITRSLVDKIQANPMGAVKGARTVPAVKNGKAAGFKLYAIRPGSLLARVGLQNGDTLVSVNGIPLAAGDAAVEMYAKLREARRFELAVIRGDAPVKLVVIVK